MWYQDANPVSSLPQPYIIPLCHHWFLTVVSMTKVMLCNTIHVLGSILWGKQGHGKKIKMGQNHIWIYNFVDLSWDVFSVNHEVDIDILM